MHHGPRSGPGAPHPNGAAHHNAPGGGGAAAPDGGPSAPISDALATLSDRGLRRLLGARTFLRGLEYFRRGHVGAVTVEGTEATGEVRANDAEPFRPVVTLSPDGIQSRCTCPVFAKTGQHCKHVAALLISVRDRARGESARAPVPAVAPNTAHAGGESKRARRRRARLNAAAAAGVAPHLVADQDATAGQTGLAAWLPPEGMQQGHAVEMRIHVRQGALTVTVLDADARVAVLPSVALTWQALFPTAERQALRVLSRFESGNPRHPAVDVRGEDVAELLPLLEECKVLLEPALKQLRFSDDVLRPRFDLDAVGGDTIIVKAAFERQGDARKFNLLQGGWFEGWPCWHIDTQEGIARRVDRRVAPAAMRRLLKSPTIAEPMGHLVSLVMQGLPRIALEMGAELPDLSQIADVVDMEPTFRMRATGSLMEAGVELYAAYGDDELPVRADGITPPVLIRPPQEGSRRPTCVRVDIAAQQAAVHRLLDLGLSPNDSGENFQAMGDAALRFWTEGLGQLPETWDLFVPEHLVDTQVRSTHVDTFAKVTSGVDWLNVNIQFSADGIGVDRDELRKCLQEGKKFVRLEDGSFAAFDPAKVRAMLDREIELLAAADKSGKLPLSQAGRVQELLRQADDTTVASKAKKLFEQLGDIESIAKAKKPRSLRATLRP
ncbi:MAG: SNF2 helicase associated domain-containing protein, partial [Myxococcota bacterium]